MSRQSAYARLEECIMRLGELCRRLQVPLRDGRYVLEQGIIPKGVEESPDRGNHRHLTAEQAFWLGLVLKLKGAGIKAPVARQVADFAEEALRAVTQNLNWEWTFHPFQGRLMTEQRWYIDVGDLRYIRIATDTNPSHEGLYEFPWSILGKRKTAEVNPIVILRVDVAGLARLLY
jgi:hypothetical protein